MKTDYDYIVVGQGVAGTVMSFLLMQQGFSCLIIDDNFKESSSKVAAGIINPVTGRRYVKSWKIDTLLPKAKEVYSDLEKLLDISFLNAYPIVRTLDSAQQQNDWSARCADPFYKNYTSEQHSPLTANDAFTESFAKGYITNGAQVSLSKLLDAYRSFARNKQIILERKFDFDHFELDGPILRCMGKTARKIIFAEGWGIRNNPFFKNIPIAPNKGEVLNIDVPNLNMNYILRDKIFVVPFEQLFWSGGGYDNHFTDTLPSKQFLDSWTIKLRELLRIPFSIVNHSAAIRLATKDRKPLIGAHSQYPNIYIFNGFGTKGASLIPYFADQLIGFMEGKNELEKEVDIKRYS